jgi:hypothetical protein
MIPVLLGHDLNVAFSTSPIYQREAEQVRDDTDGVSMTISSQGKEGGKIAIFLGDWHAFALKTRLYAQ